MTLTSKKVKAKAKAKAKKKANPTKARDATAILRADHKLVSGLFADYEKSRSMPRKKVIAQKVCMELSVHTQVEEEIFYPAFRNAVDDTRLISEATVEHAALHDLIAQIEGVQTNDEMFDAKMKVLSEYVKHHVKEEHSEIFAKAKSSEMDLVQLGAQITIRKREIMFERSWSEQRGLI